VHCLAVLAVKHERFKSARMAENENVRFYANEFHTWDHKQPELRGSPDGKIRTKHINVMCLTVFIVIDKNIIPLLK